jgi:hypothetical protein
MSMSVESKKRVLELDEGNALLLSLLLILGDHRAFIPEAGSIKSRLNLCV